MKEPFEVVPFDRPGGGKSLIEFNLHHWADGADAKRPLRVDVTTELHDPNAAGLAQGPDLGDLATLQERLEIFMRRKASAKYVMRITGAGEQVHTFYVPATLGVLRKRDPRETLDSAIVGFGESSGRDLSVAFEDDPEWSRLLGVYSAHDPEQWHWDRSMLMQLAKQSDAIHARRAVAHRVYFDDRDACREFLRGVRKLRFKGEGGPKNAKAGKPGAFVIVVVRTEQTLATWYMHPVVLSVKAVALEHGGTYAGWETELVPSLEPPPLAPASGLKLG